ncbi:MAG TPA: PQQ-dependent sugar dehydrogenase [Thermoanaerobaculia bacterium]|nr:PQQ-dependent sugar dehydrogenase [Thermoanaerobaculia bacterium]
MNRLLLASVLILACTETAPVQSAPPGGVSVVAQGLEVPWSIVFAPDGRMLVTERPGRVRAIEKGVLRPQPLLSLTNVVATGEAGLMGLALHPDFAKNHFVYLCYATEGGDDLTDVVMRYRDTGASLVEPRAIVQNIPAARFHAGCRLKFGPDRKLYITTGDATTREIAQNLHNLGGKILRVNDDGTVPQDNPFAGSPIWSYGHRNPQGIDWDPKSGLLFETEHGPSGFDGGSGGDEVNIVERGRNYGWPEIMHHDKKKGMESPLLDYTPACAPASGAFWRGDFYFGCLRGENLHRVVLDPKDRRKVLREEKLFTDLGRIREVAVGPDGALYFSTSNRDGRGNPAKTDDRIFRLPAGK